MNAAAARMTRWGVVPSLSSMQPPAEADPIGERLEPALEALDAQLAEKKRSLNGASQALKKAQDAARTGNLRDLNRLLAAAADSAEAYLREIRRAQNSWQFSGEDYLASDAYLDELRATAAELGVGGVRVLDGRLHSYPHIVRVEPRDLAVRVGKKKYGGVRPSHVAKMLRAAQAKPQQVNLAAVLSAIEQAYLHLTKGELGHAVPLRQIHEVLTLLPGSAKEYSLDDLVMDVYRLDLSGPNITRANNRFDLPASSSTRGGRGIRFATREGEEKLYSTIRFLRAT
jgi:hypothetical protein